MKIQISPIKKIEEAMVIWPTPLPDVDLALDPRQGMGFKNNSIRAIYAFGILGITPQKNILKMLKNFVRMLKPKGELYIIEQDMDYILRSILGGDLSLSEFNKHYRKTTYLNQEEIIQLLEKIGFPSKEQVLWKKSPSFEKKNSEIIISIIKK